MKSISDDDNCHIRNKRKIQRIIWIGNRKKWGERMFKKIKLKEKKLIEIKYVEIF